LTVQKRKKTRKGNKYFTKEHENAIIEYIATDSKAIRTRLYIDLIQPAFDELVDKIVYTYKFTTLPNIDYLKDECKIWLITVLDKYNPDSGSKAFSYFSVITKNWFIHKVKRNSRDLKREISYENINSESNQRELICEESYIKDRENYEFWLLLYKEMDNWNKLKLKENEKKVLDAIKILFESANEIEIFNKKAIYLYMREITGLNTKQIVNNLNKIKIRYRTFRKKWNKGDL
jgi:hypothetical protein